MKESAHANTVFFFLNPPLATFRKKLLVLLPLLLCCWTLLNAQCTGGQAIHANNVGSTQFGQYIQANCTGVLTNFTYEIVDGAGASATVTVRSGIGCSGTILGTQTIAQVIGVNSVNFSPVIPVTNGQNYSIIIVASGPTGIKTNQSGTYSTGGLLWTPTCDVFGASGSWDMVFSYTISPPIPCTTPTAYSVSGSGIICPSASIGLSGSQSGHTYQLRRNGANTGSPVNGTGSALTFPATQTGTYTVVATSPAGGTCTALMSGSAVLTNAWVQTGLDINGEAANDRSGTSVSLSSDGSTVAIGAIGNNNNKGHVRVYKWVSGAWIQQGADIDGEAANDQSGWSVSLSSDGSIVAIGAIGNNNSKGHVRVYKWVSGAWIQQGADIDGEAANDESGFSVSLSSDGSVVAIGARYNNDNGYLSGHVRVYKWVSSAWIQQGSDIAGEVGNDLSGFSVSLSSDGSTVAIGAPYNGSFSGHVRVYKWVSGAWTKQGNDIDGEAAYDVSGWSVSLSSDGSVVAIGARQNNDNGYLSGHARVYKWVSGAWTKQGDDINGEAAGDNSGTSVSLSSDGSIVAIGAENNDGNGTNSGHVRVYKWVSGAWIQQGADIDGEAAEDYSGHSVSLSSDGSSVAIGALYNGGNGFNSGHVRVYTLIPCTTPTAYSVSGPGIICPSASAIIGLSGSQSGHTYQLQLNGTNTGSPVNGTGSALTFQATQTGTYTVVATSPAGCTCTALMSGSAVLTNDNAPPTFTCPANTTVNTNGSANCAVLTPNLLTGITDEADNCGTANLSQLPPVGTTQTGIADGGTFDVTITANDGNGNNNAVPCVVTVTVNDDDLPTISCPANQTVPTAPDNCSTPPLTYSVTTTDNCSSTVSLVSGPSSGSVFPLGVNTVVWKATDPGGNSTTCAFTVTVGDLQNPSIVCPANISRNTDANQCTAVVDYATPSVSDNCTGWTLTRTGGLASGSVFSKGVNMVQWQVSDVGGNLAICQFTITVTDNQPPIITCPPSIVRSADLNMCSAVVTYASPTFSDNCGEVALLRIEGPVSGSTFPKGMTSVIWQATDAVSLTQRCTFTVTVTDGQVPSITCPGSLTRNTDPGQCSAVVTYAAPTASDNCTALPTVTIHSGPASGSVFPKGVSTVAWKATDEAGLTKTCTFRVTVNDTELPSITCPSNQTVNTSGSSCASAALTYSVTASDNCSTPAPTLARVSGPASGSTFPKGVTNVVWRATDASAKVRTCSFTVTVTDNVAPLITCPASVTASGTVLNGACSAVVTYANATATDNCSVASVVLQNGVPSGSGFPEGATVNIFRAMDDSGLTATCSFTVTVGCGTGANGSEVEVRSSSSEALSMDQAQPITMTLAPNPATTEVLISIAGLGQSGGELRVYNAQGRTLLQQLVAVQQPTLRLDVSGERFAAGVYFVTLRSEGRTMTKRLVVARI